MAHPSLADFGIARGDVLDGRYRVERLLGVGGAGFVVAAHHLQLDEPRALKLLRPEARVDPRHVARFQREARAVAKIKGEHVCPVHDVGDAPPHGAYIVMDLLEGDDLRDLLRERGPLAVADAVRHALEACHALAHAHAAGIVHRDLKPANLFLARRPDGPPIVKVVDFGISKLQGGAIRPGEPALTTPTMMMGSLAYLPPEQALDPTTVDHRADIWGVGVVLYELLTAERAFQGTSATGVLMEVMTGMPRRCHEIRPEIPAALDEVVARCLAKDRDDRFPTIAELATALAPFAPGSSRLVASIVAISRPQGAEAAAPASEPAAASSGTVVLEEPGALAPSPSSASPAVTASGAPTTALPPSSGRRGRDGAVDRGLVPPSMGSAATLFQPPTPSSPSSAGWVPASGALASSTPRYAAAPADRAQGASGGRTVAILVGAVTLVVLVAVGAWAATRASSSADESDAAAQAQQIPGPGSTDVPEGPVTLEPETSAPSPLATAPGAAPSASEGEGADPSSHNVEGNVTATAAPTLSAPPPAPLPKSQPNNPLSSW